MRRVRCWRCQPRAGASRGEVVAQLLPSGDPEPIRGDEEAGRGLGPRPTVGVKAVGVWPPLWAVSIRAARGGG
jgi:hypothetical protein